MTTKRLNFEDFETEQLSKKQQKTIQGGDGSDIDGKDPIRGGGGGTGTL
ncbi:rSAM-modified peptide [Flavobacterium sp. 1355]|jgi:hypothetical protein|nr:rSAM-modified peptide [Flavobacterium sp. 1355]MBP1225338.1 hypothetical protein [Flavobacterium sp. 1355]